MSQSFSTSSGHSPEAEREADLQQSGPVSNQVNIADVADIAILIFRSAEKPSLATCARVNRMWCELALDALWSDLDSIVPLLRLISPVEKYRNTTGQILWRFKDYDAYDTDWEQFRTYAQRVHKLSFDDTQQPESPGSTMSFRTSHIEHAAFIYPFGNSIVPKVEYLGWNVSSKSNALSLPLFLPSTLRALTLHLKPNVTGGGSRKTFQSLQFRLQCLEQFTLITGFPASDMDAAIAAWFRSVPTLQSITLPRYYQTENLVNALKYLPKLHTIDMSSELRPPYAEDGMHLLPSNDVFNRVRRLAWTLLIPTTITPEIASTFDLLESLMMHIPAYESVISLECFLVSISRCLPSLHTLGLNLMCRVSESGVAIEWSYLHALLSLNGLIDLRIWHDWPIRLECGYVKDMANAWPLLRHLQICSDPFFCRVDYDTPLNDISIVQEFAIHMPHLISLELFITVSASLDFDGDLEPTEQFSALQTLGFGLSQIPPTAVSAAAFYLASLCRKGITITFEPSPMFEDPLPDGEPEREELWAQLKDVFRLASKSKEVQYQRRRAESAACLLG